MLILLEELTRSLHTKAADLGIKIKKNNIKIRSHPKKLEVENAVPPLKIVLNLNILV